MSMGKNKSFRRFALGTASIAAIAAFGMSVAQANMPGGTPEVILPAPEGATVSVQDQTSTTVAVDAGPDTEVSVTVNGDTALPQGYVVSGNGFDIDAELAAAVRDLPDSLDTMTATDIHRLDRGGILERQKQIGEDILIMDRELVRAEAIKRLVESLGDQGFQMAYPELYESIRFSPIILQAQIDEQNLQNTLTIARLGPEELRIETVSETSDEADYRDDGSMQFNDMNQGLPGIDSFSDYVPQPEDGLEGGYEPEVDPEPLELLEPDLGEPVYPDLEILTPGDTIMEFDIAVPDVIPMDPLETISLREVYGMGSEMRAIITYGSDRIRVAPGDELPQDTVIKVIGPNYIDVIRRGEEVRIRLHG